jgi:hypothetical protein
VDLVKAAEIEICLQELADVILSLENFLLFA